MPKWISRGKSGIGAMTLAGDSLRLNFPQTLPHVSKHRRISSLSTGWAVFYLVSVEDSVLLGKGEVKSIVGSGPATPRVMAG